MYPLAMKNLIVILSSFSSLLLLAQTNSIEYLNKKIEIATNTDSSTASRLRAYNAYFFKAVHTDKERAISLIQDFTDLAIVAEDPKYVYRANKFHTSLLTFQGKTDSALILARQNVVITQQAQLPRFVASSYINLGVVLEDLSQFDSAIYYYELGEKLTTELNHTVEMARSKMNLANLFEKQGELVKSSELYNEALNICLKKNLSGYLPFLFTSLGNNYYKQGNYNKAIEYYKEGLDRGTKHKYQKSESEAIFNLSKVYLELGQPDSALWYLISNKSLAHNYLPFSTKYYYMMGRVYYYHDNPSSSIKYLDSAIHQSKINRDSTVINQVLYYQGINLIEANKIKLGEQYLLKSHALSNQYKDIEFQLKSNLALYEFYKTDSPLKAIDYNDNYLALLKAYDNIRTDKKTIQYQYKIAYEQRQFQDSVLAKKNLELVNFKHDEEIKDKNNALSALFIIVVLTLVAVILFFRLNKKIKQQNYKLEDLNRLNKQIFSIISHDLKGPLLSMSFYADIFKNTNLSAQAYQRHANDMQIQLDQTSKLLQDLLDWSKEELAIDQGQKEQSDLKLIIEESVNLMSPSIDEKEIEIVDEVAQWSRFHLNPGVLKIVTRNLITNAIKYSPNGSLIVIRQNKESLEIENPVEDFSPNMLDHLFIKPVKSKVGTNRETGFGIGLYISFELLKRLDWKISTSTHEKRKTVTFVISPNQ